MNPAKVDRSRLSRLTDLPNIGPSLAQDLTLIGITHPDELTGRDPVDLYERLCEVTGSRQDPCVLDTFMSITDFMDGGEPKVWWAYTEERKRMSQR